MQNHPKYHHCLFNMQMANAIINIWATKIEFVMFPNERNWIHSKGILSIFCRLNGVRFLVIIIIISADTVVKAFTLVDWIDWTQLNTKWESQLWQNICVVIKWSAKHKRPTQRPAAQILIIQTESQRPRYFNGIHVKPQPMSGSSPLAWQNQIVAR